MTEYKFILASASPRRKELLAQLGVIPDDILSPNIDETSAKGELPKAYTERMAVEKAQKVANERPGSIVLAADTVVACGRRILPKAETEKEATACLRLLSGRRHRVYTSVAVINAKGAVQVRTSESQVKFARLTRAQVESYLASKEWQGKAGGYAIQGAASAFIPWMSGSASGIIGLPLYETRLMLEAAGVSISFTSKL